MGVKGLNCLVFLSEAVVAKEASNEGNHFHNIKKFT